VPVGVASAVEIAARLVDRHDYATAVGTAIVGRTPPLSRSASVAGDPLERVTDAAVNDVNDLGRDHAVAVIETAAGGLVIAYNGAAGMTAVEHYLDHFRHASAKDRAVLPRHIRLATATRTAKLHDLLASCPDPKLAAVFESGDRVLHVGERYKCVAP